MNELNIAAQIRVSALNKGNDELFFLEVVRLAKLADMGKLIEIYQKIINGEIVVVKITTSVALTDAEKEKLESKINDKFSDKKLAFAYVVEPGSDKAIEIQVGDDLIEFSFT